jgi:hypothetical protein
VRVVGAASHQQADAASLTLAAVVSPTLRVAAFPPTKGPAVAPVTERERASELKNKPWRASVQMIP